MEHVQSRVGRTLQPRQVGKCLLGSSEMATGDAFDALAERTNALHIRRIRQAVGDCLKIATQQTLDEMVPVDGLERGRKWRHGSAIKLAYANRVLSIYSGLAGGALTRVKLFSCRPAAGRLRTLALQPYRLTMSAKCMLDAGQRPQMLEIIGRLGRPEGQWQFCPFLGPGSSGSAGSFLNFGRLPSRRTTIAQEPVT